MTKELQSVLSLLTSSDPANVRLGLLYFDDYAPDTIANFEIGDRWIHSTKVFDWQSFTKWHNTHSAIGSEFSYDIRMENANTLFFAVKCVYQNHNTPDNQRKRVAHALFSITLKNL